jgi:catechol 2,3-dioxygenase-like lactoylglutathione lyase family enzyme
MRMHHIAITTADMEASIDFYTRHLHLKVVARYPSATFLSDGHGMHLELLPRPPDTPAEEGTVVNHLAFLVDDVAAEAARLREAGIHFHTGPLTAANGAVIANCRAPEGTVIQLWQAPPDFPR